MSKQREKWEKGYFSLILRRISARLLDDSNVFLKELGIQTPSNAVTVLMYIRRNPNCSAADIIPEVFLTHQGVTKNVNLLIKRGLVDSRPSGDDQRKRSLSITEAGEQEAKKILRAVEISDAALDDLFDEIDTDVHQALEKFEGALNADSWLNRLRSHTDS